jgi:hypothetical protein
MTEDWITFPAQIGDQRAFITFDNGFVGIIDADPRTISLEVRASIRHPSSAGLPEEHEFASLRAVDVALDSALSKHGAAYVGRVTLRGYRHFFFYVDIDESLAADLVAEIAGQSGYELVYAWKEDPAKEDYWRKLYPTMDDWQLIRDMAVLEQLSKSHDLEQVPRRILHWARLPDQDAVNQFSLWLAEQGYELVGMSPPEQDGVEVSFSHEGGTALAELTSHTIRINRRVKATHGSYLGWESPVVTKQVGSTG